MRCITNKSRPTLQVEISDKTFITFEYSASMKPLNSKANVL